MVGIVQRGKQSFYSFGSLGDEVEGEIGEDTIFEIGSITKVFTALVLADMVAKGEVALEDSVAKYLPGDWQIPTPGDRPITLGSLADHTSGLPTIPANFWKQGDKIYNSDIGGLRWRDYSEQHFSEYFDDPTPLPDPQRKYIYSNLGSGVLGYALARKAGCSLDELIRERICEPLGMQKTSFVLESTGPGHNPDGNVAAPWTAGDSVLRGAFALRSTTADMLKFAEIALDATGSPTERALTLSMKPRASINDLEKTALGWKVNKFGVVYTAGATGGFRCALFLHPKSQTAVLALANSQVGGVTGGRATLFDALVGSLLNVTLGAPPLKAEFPMPLDSGSDSLTEYIGNYRPVTGSTGPSFPVSVRLSHGQLTAQGPGDIEIVLWKLAKDVYFTRSYLGEMRFRRDDSGKVSGMDLSFDGRISKLRREPAAEK